MAWTDAGSRGYQLLIEDGKFSVGLIHFWPGNAIGIRAREPVPIGKWTHVAISYDGSSRASGLALYVDGSKADCEVVRDKLTKNITGGSNDFLTVGQSGSAIGWLQERPDRRRNQGLRPRTDADRSGTAPRRQVYGRRSWRATPVG